MNGDVTGGDCEGGGAHEDPIEGEKGEAIDYVKRLQRAVQFKTVSDTNSDGSAFFVEPQSTSELNAYLMEQFTSIFASQNKNKVEFELVNNGSLLIHVKSETKVFEDVDVENHQQKEEVEDVEKDAKGPFLLIAHTDVVPTNDSEWTVPPFEGQIKDGYLYGRGVLDDKGAVMAILESLNSILSDSNLLCCREFFVAITHDEEVQGQMGAKEVVPKLTEKLNGRSLDFILDEGLVILEDFRAGLPPIALIGICEKGYADFKLTLKTQAGHSSLPPSTTAITEMCQAIDKLNKFKFPSHLRSTPMHKTMETIAPHMPASHRSMIKSINTSEFMLKRFLTRDPINLPQMQTTKVCTMISGGSGRNIVPCECVARVNCRLHPSDKVEDIKLLVEKAVGPKVQVELLNSCEAPKCSSTDSDAYNQVVKAIEQTFSSKKLLIAPGLLTGMTDSRHFQHMTENIYRFNPYTMQRSDIERVHGHDERIAVENYGEQIQFFKHFITNCAFTAAAGASSPSQQLKTD